MKKPKITDVAKSYAKTILGAAELAGKGIGVVNKGIAKAGQKINDAATWVQERKNEGMQIHYAKKQLSSEESKERRSATQALDTKWQKKWKDQEWKKFISQ